MQHITATLGTDGEFHGSTYKAVLSVGAFNFTVLKARSPTIEGASFRECCDACTLKNTFVDFDRVGILLIPRKVNLFSLLAKIAIVF